MVLQDVSLEQKKDSPRVCLYCAEHEHKGNELHFKHVSDEDFRKQDPLFVLVIEFSKFKKQNTKSSCLYSGGKREIYVYEQVDLNSIFKKGNSYIIIYLFYKLSLKNKEIILQQEDKTRNYKFPIFLENIKTSKLMNDLSSVLS